MKKLKNLLFFVLVGATLFLIPALAFGTVAEAQSLAEKVKDYTSLAEFSAENNKNNSSLAEVSASDGFSFLYFGDVQFTDDMNSEYAAFGKMLDGAYAKNPQIAFACGVIAFG